jgi:thiol-disulfide isomerase/thioredoxin
MKLTLLLLCLFSIVFVVHSQTDYAKPDCKTLLVRVSRKLASLQHIRYHYKRVLNYSSENYHNEMDALVYLDFQSTDTLTGFRYQLGAGPIKEVFNGTEKFILNEKEKTMDVDPQPLKKSFTASFFYNSVITLKNALPAIISDREIEKLLRDTSINHRNFYIITLTMHKKTISNLGNHFDEMTQERNIIYTITIDAKSLLPVTIRQANSINTDFTETNFTAIDTISYTPAAGSWFYTTYLAEYKPATQKDTPPLLATGANAPNWTLPFYNKTETIALNKMKGRVILLDFWIKNCGPCIESTPYLNALHKKFNSKGVEFLSINAYDSKEDISWFCKKHAIGYKVLMNGKAVAEQYGVSGFPTFFIIDKKGKIIYAAPGFTPAIAAVIEKTIEKIL